MEYPIEITECPCESPICNYYFLKGVGHFCQGSGFSKEEAETIRDLLNAHQPIGINAEHVFKGRRVIYVPPHAFRNQKHSDCRTGCINRMADIDKSAFVLYDTPDTEMVTGDEDYAAALTKLEDLAFI